MRTNATYKKDSATDAILAYRYSTTKVQAQGVDESFGTHRRGMLTPPDSVGGVRARLILSISIRVGRGSWSQLNGYGGADTGARRIRQASAV